MGNYSVKNIVLGIGIGLVFSSMINISISNKELTVDEIKMEAAKHNLIILTKEEILNSQPQGIIQEPTPTLAPTPTPTPTPSPTPTPEASSNAPEPTSAAGNKAKITVSSGMSSEAIAELLRDAGVLKDTKAFLKRLGEVGKENKLKIGTFEITKGAKYDDIINILTK
jgi:hypothetical protein